MVTVDDVAAYIGGRLLAVSGIETVLPGGAWFDRGPDVPAGYPYAVFKVTGEAPEWNSGNLYTHNFRVQIAAYAPVGLSGVDIQNVQKAMLKIAWDTTVSLRNATEKVLSVRPSGNDPRNDTVLRGGRDVFISGQTYDVLVQGDRSVS